MPIAKIKELKNVCNAGIYCISSTEPKKGLIDVKIGRTIDFKNRLNAYHICWNEGFYIYDVLPLHKKYKLKTKAERKASLDMTIILENELFNMMKDKNVKTTTRTHKSEWFRCSSDYVADMFQKLHEKFPNDTANPITRWSDPLIHIFDVDGFTVDTLKTQEEPPSFLPQDGQITRKGRIIKSTKHTKFKDFEYIVS